MDKKRKQLGIRSFLTSKRASLSPNLESDTTKSNSADARDNSPEADEKTDEENSSESDNDIDNDCQGEGQTESLDMYRSATGVVNKKSDIASAVGTYLRKQERYKFLKNKWKPPKGFEFPSIEISGKRRRFQKKWLKKYAWLAYSPQKNGGFCLFCVLFTTSSAEVRNQPLGSFVTKPWTRFHSATEEFRSHSATKYHCTAAGKAGEFEAQYKAGETCGVIAKIDKSIQDNIRKNRERLVPIVKTVLFCGRHELPFRGHRDDGEILSPEANQSCLQGSQGIFRGLLAFRMDAGDYILQNHLASASKKETLISKTIQNELIEVIGQHIQSELVQKILKAHYFSILVDESSDCNKMEQMSVCIRFLDTETCSLREDFIGFSAVTDTTGEGLKTALCSFLDEIGLDLANCRGQGYDGGSNMSGKFKGLQALVLKEQPKALYTHCFSHDLNLSVSKACDIALVRNTIGTVSTVSTFLSASPQRVAKLERIVKSANLEPKQKKRIRPFCPTRWVERHESLLTFRFLYEQILETLEEIQLTCDAQSSSLAFAYEAALKRTEFIITLETLCYVMTVTKTLCVSLQSLAMDLSKAVEQVQITVKALQQVKKNAKAEFNSIYEKSSKLADSIGVTLIVPRVTKRQNYRHQSNSTSPQEYYFEPVFLKLLDHYVDDLNSRFSAQAKDAFALQGLIPSRLLDTSDEEIFVGAKFYEDDLSLLSFDDFRAELALWRAKWNGQKNLPLSALEALQGCDNLTPNIYKLLQIFITLPVTTCTVERSFSALKRLKTSSRSTMLEPRLNGVALMSIHKSMSIDEMTIIDKFAKAKPRRLEVRDISVECV